MPDKLIAYHGDPDLKARVMRKIAAHRAADAIAKGAYVRTNGRTTYCAVGCLLEDSGGGHMRYESEFGIPAQLAYLEDGVFESLPSRLAIPWPERFMGAIAEFTLWQDNVRAVALGLEALRAVDRYGMTRRGEQYAGWRQLEADSKPSHGRELLRKYGGEKAALFATHPDRGGSARDFDDVRAAIAQ